MTGSLTIPELTDDATIVRLAREIATNLYDIETILIRYRIDTERFRLLKNNPRFQKVLEAEVLAWESATNTQERTKLKAAAMLELWLEEANIRMHDGDENLAPKVELAKFIARLAGFSDKGADVAVGGDRFSVTINLNGNAALQVQREAPPQIIDLDAAE